MIPEVDLAFGPVPSRRLGMSLGINNIPPKVCSYGCVYCQLGSTLRKQSIRTAFYEPIAVVRAVADRVERVRSYGITIDYLTFVPDGEPTLDMNLGKEISGLKELGLKVAVITNSSLLWQEGVREDLMGADWVSLKVDTVDPSIWLRINRPALRNSLGRIKQGILSFAKEYDGELVTETMLVSGLNDGEETLRTTSEFIRRLEPRVAYVSIPIRPPAEKWVKPPDEVTINRAYQVFGEEVDQVVLLTGYEGNLFAHTGDVADDILGITAVHPMRKEAIEEMLSEAHKDWHTVEALLLNGKLREVEYNGVIFYIRRRVL